MAQATLKKTYCGPSRKIKEKWAYGTLGAAKEYGPRVREWPSWPIYEPRRLFQLRLALLTAAANLTALEHRWSSANQRR